MHVCFDCVTNAYCAPLVCQLASTLDYVIWIINAICLGYFGNTEMG